MTLRGVGACFVERIDFCQVIPNPRLTQVPKMDAGHFREASRFSVYRMNDPHPGPDFMDAPTQPPQNMDSVLEIRRFTQNLAIDRNERVGRQHDRIWE